MALTKIVDGKTVKLTAAEEKAVKDEWTANDAKVPEDRTEQEIDSNPFYKVCTDLMVQATGKTKQEIVDLVKAEKAKTNG